MATGQPQREWFEKDYYAVLGVPRDAPAKDITRAYRKLAREHHPDARPGDKAAEERFKEISAAYDVLGDAEKRRQYDEVRRLGASPFGAGGAGGPGGFGFEGDVGDLGDLLGNLFGRGGGGRRRGRGAAGGPQRGDDLEAALHLDFEDAVRGLTTSIHLDGDAACATCGGNGSRPGSTPQVCGSCGCRGVREENQGLFSFSQLCTACGGRGTLVTDPCPTCRGTGAERRARQVKVRVPAGVEDGQRLRLAGRGGPGRGGGPSGDLFVRVSVGRHPVFGRKGRNLTIAVPVSFPEAALGTELRVPTLDGAVTVKLPAGTASGTTLRVKGRGVPDEGRHPAGDLLVTVEVAVPKRLSRQQRKAVEALAVAFDGESPREHLEEPAT